MHIQGGGSRRLHNVDCNYMNTPNSAVIAKYSNSPASSSRASIPNGDGGGVGGGYYGGRGSMDRSDSIMGAADGGGSGSSSSIGTLGSSSKSLSTTMNTRVMPTQQVRCVNMNERIGL